MTYHRSLSQGFGGVSLEAKSKNGFYLNLMGWMTDIDINTEHKEFSNWCWMRPSSSNEIA